MIGSRAGEICGEALHAAGPAALMRVARAFRLEQRLMEREPRLAAPGIGERHRYERLVAEIAGGVFPGKGEDEALRRHDLAIGAASAMPCPVGRAHAGAIGAARPHIHLAGNRREALRPPPLRRLLLIGPGREHNLARSEEHTSELQSLTNLVCRLLL